MIKHCMKKLFLLCLCSLGLYGTLFPQSPTGAPIASPTAATAATAATSIASPAATAAPNATSSSSSNDLADRIHRKLGRKLGQQHGVIIDGGDQDGEELGGSNDIPTRVPTLVAILFLTIFGAPVLIVM